jgi:hypothetical protein
MYSRERVPAPRPSERTVEEAARGPVEQEQPQGYVLGLQQKSGNAAVARLVQRAPADKPASTDARPVITTRARGTGRPTVERAPWA